MKNTTTHEAVHNKPTCLNRNPGGGGGGCGADPVLMTHVYPYDIAAHAPNWVAEHQGVRLPASPPLWASTSRRTEAEKCCKPAANYSSSPPHAYQPLLRRRMSTNSGEELSLRHWTVATQRRCRITGTFIAASTEMSRV